MQCDRIVMMKLPKSLTTVTWFSKFIFVFLFIIFLLGAFRLGMRYQRAIDVSQQLMPISPQPTAMQSSHTITITMQDNGEEKQAKVGDTVLLHLTDGLDWNIHLSNDTVLKQVTGESYKAIAPGSVVISATGRIKCPKGAMCLRPIVAFTTTLVVSQ